MVELHVAGLTHQQIADHMGMRSRQAVQQRIARYIEKYGSAFADQERFIQAVQLQDLWRVAYAQAMQGALAAVDRCLAIIDRRARLFGLIPVPAPTLRAVATAGPVQIAVSVSYDLAPAPQLGGNGEGAASGALLRVDPIQVEYDDAPDGNGDSPSTATG